MSSGSGRIDVSNFFSPPPPPDPKVTIVFGMIVKEGEDDIIIENRFKAVALEELGEQEIKHQQDARAAAERNLLEQEVYHGGSVSVRKKSRNATASNSTTNGAGGRLNSAAVNNMSQRSSSISSAAAVAATAVGNRRQSLMVPNMGGTSDHRTSLMVPGGLSSATASTGRRGTKLGLGISNSVTRRTSSTTSSNILPILGGNTSRRGSALGFDTSGAPSRRGSAVSTVKKGITHTPSGTKFFISEEDEEQQLQNRMSSVTRSRRGSAVLESVYEKDHEIKIRIEGDDEPSSNGRASLSVKPQISRQPPNRKMKHPDFKQFARVPVIFPKSPSIWGMLDPPVKFEIPNPKIEETTEKFLNRLEMAQKMIANANTDIRGYKCDISSMDDEIALLEDFEVKSRKYIKKLMVETVERAQQQIAQFQNSERLAASMGAPASISSVSSLSTANNSPSSKAFGMSAHLSSMKINTQIELKKVLELINDYNPDLTSLANATIAQVQADQAALIAAENVANKMRKLQNRHGKKDSIVGGMLGVRGRDSDASRSGMMLGFGLASNAGSRNNLASSRRGSFNDLSAEEGGASSTMNILSGGAKEDSNTSLQSRLTNAVKGHRKKALMANFIAKPRLNNVRDLRSGSNQSSTAIAPQTSSILEMQQQQQQQQQTADFASANPISSSDSKNTLPIMDIQILVVRTNDLILNVPQMNSSSESTCQSQLPPPPIVPSIAIIEPADNGAIKTNNSRPSSPKEESRQSSGEKENSIIESPTSPTIETSQISIAIESSFLPGSSSALSLHNIVAMDGNDQIDVMALADSINQQEELAVKTGTEAQRLEQRQAEDQDNNNILDESYTRDISFMDAVQDRRSRRSSAISKSSSNSSRRGSYVNPEAMRGSSHSRRGSSRRESFVSANSSASNNLNSLDSMVINAFSRSANISASSLLQASNELPNEEVEREKIHIQQLQQRRRSSVRRQSFLEQFIGVQQNVQSSSARLMEMEDEVAVLPAHNEIIQSGISNQSNSSYTVSATSNSDSNASKKVSARFRKITMSAQDGMDEVDKNKYTMESVQIPEPLPLKPKAVVQHKEPIHGELEPQMLKFKSFPAKGLSRRRSDSDGGGRKRNQIPITQSHSNVKSIQQSEPEFYFSKSGISASISEVTPTLPALVNAPGATTSHGVGDEMAGMKKQYIPTNVKKSLSRNISLDTTHGIYSSSVNASTTFSIAGSSAAASASSLVKRGDLLKTGSFAQMLSAFKSSETGTNAGSSSQIVLSSNGFLAPTASTSSMLCLAPKYSGGSNECDRVESSSSKSDLAIFNSKSSLGQLNNQLGQADQSIDQLNKSTTKDQAKIMRRRSKTEPIQPALAAKRSSIIHQQNSQLGHLADYQADASIVSPIIPAALPTPHALVSPVKSTFKKQPAASATIAVGGGSSLGPTSASAGFKKSTLSLLTYTADDNDENQPRAERSLTAGTPLLMVANNKSALSLDAGSFNKKSTFILNAPTDISENAPILVPSFHTLPALIAPTNSTLKPRGGGEDDSFKKSSLSLASASDNSSSLKRSTLSLFVDLAESAPIIVPSFHTPHALVAPTHSTLKPKNHEGDHHQQQEGVNGFKRSSLALNDPSSMLKKSSFNLFNADCGGEGQEGLGLYDGVRGGRFAGTDDDEGDTFDISETAPIIAPAFHAMKPRSNSISGDGGGGGGGGGHTSARSSIVEDQAGSRRISVGRKMSTSKTSPEIVFTAQGIKGDNGSLKDDANF